MEVTRVVVTLTHFERKALIDLALSELRTPSDQAHFIIRQELERWGLLPKHDDEKVDPDENSVA